MTEFKITQLTTPGEIAFNYEELKAEITEKAEIYASLVYTDATISEAKTDRANLNRLKKALNDERIRREKEFMAPFNDFKTKVNEIIGIIDRPVGIIDQQVKAYEEQEKETKRKGIGDLFESIEEKPEWLKLEQIWNEKWLNKTAGMNTIETEINTKLQQISNEQAVIASLGAFAFEAGEVYKQTLDLPKAIAEGQRLADIQRRKEEAEKARAEAEKARAEAEQKAAEQIPAPEPTPATTPGPAEETPKAEEPKGQWVSFRARLTRPQALALRDFCQANGIEIEPIR